jgi:hypothetical protein
MNAMKADMQSEFERCWQFLAPAVDARTHTKAGLLQLIEEGRAYFCPMPDAAVVGGITTYDNGFRDATARWAGGNLYTLKQWVPTLEAWAKGRGCNRAVLFGREQWLRALPDYEKIGVRMAKELPQ